MAMMILGTVAKLTAAAATAVYLGLVLMSYKLDGPRQQLRIEWRDPLHAVLHILVWAGVKALASVFSFGHSLFALLSETSAELGEEYVRRRPRGALAAFRSRFI